MRSLHSGCKNGVRKAYISLKLHFKNCLGSSFTIYFHHKSKLEILRPQSFIARCTLGIQQSFEGSTGKLEEALTLYNQMRYKEILASVEAHEALVSGLARLGQIEIACKIFTALKGMCGMYTKMMYGTLIIGLSKAGHIVEARKFWNEATERGLILTKTVFTALIEGLVKIGDHMEAYILYMEYKNSGRTPDVAVLDLLIAPLALNGEVDEAYQLLQELTTVACVRIPNLFNFVIKGFANERRLAEAVKVFEEMPVISWRRLASVETLPKLWRANRADEANELWMEMRVQGIQPL
ncbi:hypothetical protein GOP47_0028318 [Adiantum capillus-veneris]|nr:hypothetical protein GOP47_0028318 [Adiantum capillus-veneris]